MRFFCLLSAEVLKNRFVDFARDYKDQGQSATERLFLAML